jgi:probable HAF family extracellular repeat protein
MRACLLLALLASLAAPVLRAQSFEGLGHLPVGAGAPGSYATAVSADGDVVVGYSASNRCNSNHWEPFRWEGGVLAGLGCLDPDVSNPSTYAYGVSADGAVVVGEGFVEGIPDISAFRWEGGAMSVVVDDAAAAGASADGSVVVGFVRTTPFTAFRWEGGVVTALQAPAGPYSRARAVSPDGSVIVGWAGDGVRGQAIRWENGVGSVLALPPGGVYADAHAVSADGTVVVGMVEDAAGTRRPCRWVDGVPELLGGTLPGVAYAVSADGRVIVGGGAPWDGGGRNDAFLWTPERGMVDLRAVLVNEYGLTHAAAWQLFKATGVSADGTVVVGEATNAVGAQEGWRAALVEAFAMTAPRADEIVPPGEPYTVRFTAPPDVDAVDLYLVERALNPGNGERVLIEEDVPADGGTYAWDVPEDLLSPSTFLIAVDADDPEREAVSERFRVRDPWYLHRVVGTLQQPEYEPLSFEHHVWSFDQSDENVWPEAYWDRLYHYYGNTEIGYDRFVEPVPDVRYDQSYFAGHTASDHPAWPAFVRAFGVEGTYATLEAWTFNGRLRHQPHPQAASEWYYMTTGSEAGYGGICYGLAVGLMAAFQDPERFDATWLPTAGGSEDLASVPLTDEVRDAAHALYVYQFGRLQQNEIYLNEAVEPVVSPRDAVERLKDLFERDDRDRDRTLMFCSEVDEDGDGDPDDDGCHAVVPYGMRREDGPGGLYSIGVYDPNFGNAEAQAVFVDSMANAWTYSHAYWFGDTGKGLTLSIPVIYAFEPASTLWPHVFEGNAAGPPLAARGGTPDVRRVRIAGAAGALTSSAGELRYEDGVLTETLPGGFVSFPFTGRASQPDAYVAPAGDAYRAEAVPDANGTAAIRAEGGPVTAGLVQTGAAGSTRTVVALLDDGLAVTGGGAGVFELSAEVVSADSTEIRTLHAAGLAASSPAGLRLTAGAGAETFRLAGAQASATYTLGVRAAAAGAYRAFVHASVPLGAGAVHTIRPSWSDLATVTVEVDADGDGDTDETLVLENEGTTVSNEPGGPEVPEAFALHAAYPNPFAAQATLRYDLPASGAVRVAVYDVLGREVAVLVDGHVAAGRHTAVLDGRGLAAGLYVVRLVAGERTFTQRLTLAR